MGSEFECSREVILPASPDEVWEAVSAPVGMSIHSFVDGVDADRIKQDWQKWLNASLARA